MATFIVLKLRGYNYEYETEITADNAKKARKQFLESWRGPEWEVAGNRIRVTKK